MTIKNGKARDKKENRLLLKLCEIFILITRMSEQNPFDWFSLCHQKIGYLRMRCMLLVIYFKDQMLNEGIMKSCHGFSEKSRWRKKFAQYFSINIHIMSAYVGHLSTEHQFFVHYYFDLFIDLNEHFKTSVKFFKYLKLFALQKIQLM